MKNPKRLFSVIIIAVLLLVLVPTTALAATGTQDGISAALTTDKASYNAGDTVTVNVKATNTNAFAVPDVKVDITLSDGLSLATGLSSIDIGTMAAGETKEYTLTATAAAAATTTTSGVSPKTGDGSLLFLWIGIAIAAAAVIGVLVYKKKRAATKFLSLLLCLVLALCAVMPGATALAATTDKSFTVSEAITVGGVSKTVSAKTTYKWDDSDHSVIDQPTGAINPDDGKDAVFSFRGEFVNLAKVTLNGVEMGQTKTDGGAKILLSYPSYTGDAGDAKSGSVVITLYADFLKTLPNGVYTLSLTFNDGGTQNIGETDFTIEREVADVTFTAVQTGGTSNATDSTGIVLTFSQAVTGLTAGNITIADDTGAAIKGALTGSGTTWTIALDDVTAEGDVFVSVGDFGNYNILTGPQTVAVYQGARHTLSVNVVTVCGSGSGSVSIQNQQASYRPGASATVTATAIAPYEFLKWVTTDDLSAAAVQDGGADAGANYTFNITGDTTLYAVFSVDSASYLNETKITIENGIVKWGTELSGVQGAVVIPGVVDGVAVTSIAQDAFLNNEAITSVILPDTLQSIGQGAFYGCTLLTGTLEIPASVTTLGTDAFARNPLLTSVTFLGNKPTTLALDAFWGCTGLTGIYYLPGTDWTGTEEFEISNNPAPPPQYITITATQKP
ncbi:leucine-rich repeat domain-containing protein [Christensenellaceae bacterium OttesenSCG-928-K19]|nr:leucine-rich repeat domain-containing protein [Christensenellaceae bacterium OttesenSCG-928-K19]